MYQFKIKRPLVFIGDLVKPFPVDLYNNIHTMTAAVLFVSIYLVETRVRLFHAKLTP